MTMEYRTAALAATDTDGRTVELLVAPYGTAAKLGVNRSERFRPGAFGTPDPDGVVLKLETGRNHEGPVIGRAVAFRDTDAGLVGTFRVSQTRDGDDALTLAGDGALGASVGMILEDVANLGGGLAEVRRADLREVTLTGTPAYRDAHVMAIRSQEDHAMDQTDTQATPVAETQPAIDVDAAITEAVTRAVDAVRGAAVEAATRDLPHIEARHRGHAYSSFGELVGDTIRHARSLDPDASDRLTAAIDAGIVDRRGVEVQVRAFATPANSTSDAVGVTPDAYVPDVLELLREGRPIANLFGSRPLPQQGNSVELPRITQGGVVGYQATQGGDVASQNVETDLPTFPKATMAGGQGVSLQAQEWSNPSYMDEVIRDHIAAYGEFLDLETIVGDGATPTASYTGILDGATDVPAGGTGILTDVIAVMGQAWTAVYQGSKRAPIAWGMNSVTWGNFLGAVDADSRPLISVDAPSNPVGLSDLSQVTGFLRGVPVIVDDNIPSNLGVGTDESPIILGSWRDALLFENQAAPVRIALTYPDVLVTDVSVYGFSALAIRRPAAFAVISGYITG
jgi:HK97 family phage prohead protease